MRFLLAVCFFLPMLCAGGMYQPSDRVRRWLHMIQARTMRAGLRNQDAAAALGLTETQYTRQMTCREGAHPSLARLGELPDEALLSIAEGICEFTGGTARIVRDEQIAAWMRMMDRLQVRLLELEERDPRPLRRMARADWPNAQDVAQEIA